MAPGDVCHGPQCSLAGLGPVPWSTATATGPVGWLGRPSVCDPRAVGSLLSLGRPTCVRCPGPLGSCSPVCPLGVLRCVCHVLGHLAPVHRCARSVRSFASAVSWATGLLFTGVPAWFVALRVRCPGPLGSCLRLRQLRVLFCPRDPLRGVFSSNETFERRLFLQTKKFFELFERLWGGRFAANIAIQWSTQVFFRVWFFGFSLQPPKCPENVFSKCGGLFFERTFEC